MEVVKNAFQGIRAGVLVLIGSALISLARQMKKELFTYSVLLLALVLILFFDINTIVVLGICAVVGIIRSDIGRKKGSK